MRIGLLTGGGDCPGLNAAIRAVVRVAEQEGDDVIGFHHGWRGVVEGDGYELSPSATKGILQCGGTILRTARFHPDEHEGGVAAVGATVELYRLDVFIVVGGDGTLGSAHNLALAGLPVIGVPKTIDNDVMGTRRCIGFDTAVATAADAIDRVHTTGESHDRLMVVEVMGRATGWLALSAGIASGADAICVPERLTDLDVLTKAIQKRHDAGSTSSVVVVAEGATFVNELEEVRESRGNFVATGLAARTGFETRLTVLGHVQRGGAPIASDRLLATNFGVLALEAAHDRAFDTMTSVLDEQVRLAPLGAVAEGARAVPQQLIDVARRLTVC
ncbi:MAG: ATP-dependent 6-phosphofructokinase [Acidimicrobiales bacterium]